MGCVLVNLVRDAFIWASGFGACIEFSADILDFLGVAERSVGCSDRRCVGFNLFIWGNYFMYHDATPEGGE